MYVRYAISDRRLFAGDDAARQAQVVRQAALLAHEGVDYFQIREKDLAAAALLPLCCAVRDAVLAAGAPMRVILNGPRQTAVEAGVGWHRTFASLDEGRAVSASCHTLQQVHDERGRNDMLLFAPVFGKAVLNMPVQVGQGLAMLRTAVVQAGATPVLALGGVTPANASSCLQAGAAGVAAIRMFLRPPPL